MSKLYLLEIAPHTPSKETATDYITQAGALLTTNPQAELIESQVTADYGKIYTIIEADSPETFAPAFKQAFASTATLEGPDRVRLVGASLDDIKQIAQDAEYLIAWDIPAELTMDEYLARKKKNAPNYAKVPEVSFLHTYVREDTAKCLCFYDAPDEDALHRARAAVKTPIDRIFKLNK